MRSAFRAHRYSAARQGIPFLFTFHEWVNWWGADFARRGRAVGQLVMARRRDQGPYSPANCYKATCVGSNRYRNAQIAEGARARHAARKAAGIPHHLEARGDGHPKSKAVITPAGRFGSAALAAEHYGITRAAMSLRCKTQLDFWYE